jgi:hypothetical protein
MLQELETIQYKYNALIEENKRLNTLLENKAKEMQELRMSNKLLKGLLYRISYKCKTILKILDNSEGRNKYSNIFNIIVNIKTKCMEEYSKPCTY